MRTMPNLRKGTKSVADQWSAFVRSDAVEISLETALTGWTECQCRFGLGHEEPVVQAATSSCPKSWYRISERHG
jgi:hypothetical protein